MCLVGVSGGCVPQARQTHIRYIGTVTLLSTEREERGERCQGQVAPTTSGDTVYMCTLEVIYWVC